MGWLNRLFARKQMEADLDKELRFHFESQVADKVRSGMAESEARRQTRLEFGGIEQIKENCRAPRGTLWLESTLQDLRYGLRQLRNAPAFTCIAVLTLALGIGANIAVFSVVNTILLRPLPFPNAHQLVRIVEKNPVSGESSKTYTADITQDFQRQNHSFQSVSGYFAFTGPNNFKLSGNGQPSPATGILVAEGFFETLGVKPAIGRLFRPEEFVHHSQTAALLTYSYWKRTFGGDPGIVGKTVDLSDKLDLNNSSVTIVGVLPETFDFGAVFSPGARTDLFVPY
ncbi:MAG: ABC transporter permease, partial [Acidobacteriaceae bacterium]